MKNSTQKFVRQCCKVGVVVMTTFVLAACAGMGKGNKANSSLDASATTYGLTTNRMQHATTLESLNSTSSTPAVLTKVINPMLAPANQTYYFAFDSARMAPKDYSALQTQIKYLLTHPKARVLLEGNTDLRGSREYNITLGSRRNISVKEQMLQLGVAPSQIVTVSYGKERPVAYGNSEKIMMLNRRVHLVYKATS